MSRHGLGLLPPEDEEDEPVNTAQARAEEDEEEDYMSMAIVEPTKPAEKETYTQRRIRKQREAEARALPPSKKALEAAARSAREEALATALPESSRGFRMMAKLGFERGQGLGRRAPGVTPGSGDAAEASNGVDAENSASKVAGPRLEPLALDMKADRGGIGLDDEKKRKFREVAGSEENAKKVKVEETPEQFRDRVGREREVKRLEGLVAAAMRVAERMDDERIGKKAGAAVGDDEAAVSQRNITSKLLREINVLYRGLERDRRANEQEKRIRHDMMQNLPSKHRMYDDPEEDEQDRMALGKDVQELEDAGEDEELAAFETLEPEEKLFKLTMHLREQYHYCFWCKCEYSDSKMEGCPGETEEDHD